MDKFAIEQSESVLRRLSCPQGHQPRTCRANEITAFIGPSGCGKSTLLKSLNRMNDLVEGCRITGTITLDGEDIYARHGRQPAAQARGHGVPEAQPLPHEHL